MSTAAKSLELLQHFSMAQPELGLSKLCRLANRDKATTYRHLKVLEDAGFLEQSPLSKQYRLGPALLMLAQIREKTVPREAAAATSLVKLAKATGETAHVSVLSGTTLYPLASHQSSTHSTRVVIDLQTFPLHATASGICALAFGPSGLIGVANENLEAFTAKTATDPRSLDNEILNASNSGFGRSNGSLEDDVHSLAAPLFDQTGLFAGAVSVASVASRFTSELEIIIRTNLINASREISRNWGGAVPQSIETSWAKSSTSERELESAL